MTTPEWLAATPGFPAQAGQVNQFLTAHQAQYIYAGTEQSSQAVGGGGAPLSTVGWLAQKFTAGASQTATGYVVVTIGELGSPNPWTFSLQPDNGSGAPSGAVLATTQIPHEYVPTSGTPMTVLLPAIGLTPSKVYWIVAETVGDANDYYWWDKSNQSSGASTSTDGATWTTQTYGLLYQVWDATVTGALTGIYEDGGDRWTVLAYNGGQLSNVAEWTVGQSPTGYAWSQRNLSYSGYNLTGVA